MNNVTLIGRLTADPASRTSATASGERTVTTLAIAVPPERGRDGDPCYIDVDVWGPAAEACARYLHKGRQVAVTGRLDLNRWTAEDGSARRAHRVVATKNIKTAIRTFGEQFPLYQHAPKPARPRHGVAGDPTRTTARCADRRPSTRPERRRKHRLACAYSQRSGWRLTIEVTR